MMYRNERSHPADDPTDAPAHSIWLTRAYTGATTSRPAFTARLGDNIRRGRPREIPLEMAEQLARNTPGDCWVDGCSGYEFAVRLLTPDEWRLLKSTLAGNIDKI